MNKRYGRVSNEELLRAMDAMTFHNGKTEVWLARV